MQELFEKYTDDEILKYYSILTAEGRKKRRMINEIMQKIDRIDENSDKEDIDVLYETVNLLLPTEFIKALDRCVNDGNDVDVELDDMYSRIIVTLTSKLFKIHFKYENED